MKKIFKVLLSVFALISICLATSAVLKAGPEDQTDLDSNDSNYCVYQTMSHCPGEGLNYACKISATAEACRRYACCQPF